MAMIRTLMMGLLLMAGATSTLAQTSGPNTQPITSDSTVTVSISTNGVRFTALGSIRQIRLEVFSAGGGDSLYSSGFKSGNVRDWALEDKQGQRLPDGTYLCIITVRDLAGRLIIKQGNVLVQSGQASLQMAQGEQASAVEPEKALAPVTENTAPAVTVTAHDGNDGQVVSTRGGLTFRAGDFFAGRDKELMRLTPSGWLGIGTDKPAATLDVAGMIRAKGIRFSDGTQLTSAGGSAVRAMSDSTPTANISGTGTTNKLSKWTDSSGTLADSAVTEAGGNVGIGTATPSYGLVIGPDFAPGLAWAAATVSKGAGQSASIVIGPDRTRAVEFGWDNTNQRAVMNAPGTNVIAFTQNGTNERLRIHSNGNIGIGTNNPQSPLDVHGNMQVLGNAVVTGNIAAKYQDVAEWVPARQEMAAGTVVILDTTRANTVAPSKRPYDTHVAGVISAQPGVILGESGTGKALVATTGRVRIRVDATRHAIKVGDLLVTSGKPGLAMKSRPIRAGRVLIHRPGTIIGKALEPLASGEGDILVLLSLQ